ncbi:hypothetical protein [Myroides odoratimimus]|nr:hypothetical protein [Myroides odoratimimus]
MRLTAAEKYELIQTVTTSELYAPEQVHLVRYNYSSTTFEFNVL